MAKRLVDKKHLQRICTLPCMICGGEAIAHHLLRTGSHSMGRKAGDDEAVPLCNAHHCVLHANGDEIKFFENNGWNYSRVIAHAKMLYEETLRNRL